MRERVIAEINVGNLKHNLNEVRKCVNSNSKIMVIVKANAYGHGIAQISKYLDDFGVDCFGVAIMSEAIELRKNGIIKPILILGYFEQSRVKEMLKNDIAQTIFKYEDAEFISDEAKKVGICAKIHIKIDTGMNRIGFRCEGEIIDEIKKIYGLPNILIEGTYTHFANADLKDKKATFEQIERYEKVIAELENRGMNVQNKHVLNSAGIIDLGKRYSMNCVRPGIMLYGLYPSDEVCKINVNLKPVMSLKTKVIFIKEVNADEYVSYGGAFVTNRKTRVATIPIGYADGYNRKLTNKGRVLIKGEYANVIGKVCMGQFMVDVTDIDGVNVGDEVILFGEQKGKPITATELGNICDTINYEIICGISDRVTRRYVF
ncbi:MAG TPA: alanine racemase [Clostridiales bacterium]|nr:alanine racemase [Clostridiales bacterium]